MNFRYEQVSSKVEPLSISATVATIALVIKYRTTPRSVVLLGLVTLRHTETGTINFDTSVNVSKQVSTFKVHMIRKKSFKKYAHNAVAEGQGDGAVAPPKNIF